MNGRSIREKADIQGAAGKMVVKVLHIRDHLHMKVEM